MGFLLPLTRQTHMYAVPWSQSPGCATHILLPGGILAQFSKASLLSLTDLLQLSCDFIIIIHTSRTRLSRFSDDHSAGKAITSICPIGYTGRKAHGAQYPLFSTAKKIIKNWRESLFRGSTIQHFPLDATVVLMSGTSGTNSQSSCSASRVAWRFWWIGVGLLWCREEKVMIAAISHSYSTPASIPTASFELIPALKDLTAYLSSLCPKGQYVCMYAHAVLRSSSFLAKLSYQIIVSLGECFEAHGTRVWRSSRGCDLLDVLFDVYHFESVDMRKKVFGYRLITMMVRALTHWRSNICLQHSPCNRKHASMYFLSFFSSLFFPFFRRRGHQKRKRKKKKKAKKEQKKNKGKFRLTTIGGAALL